MSIQLFITFIILIMIGACSLQHKIQAMLIICFVGICIITSIIIGYKNFAITETQEYKINTDDIIKTTNSSIKGFNCVIADEETQKAIKLSFNTFNSSFYIDEENPRAVIETTKWLIFSKKGKKVYIPKSIYKTYIAQ